MSKPQEKEWTLMFYFASDNPLAPGILSQLKAIKQAGFHPEANVIAQFDPNTEDTPTHIFDVNLVNKLESSGRPNIGFVANDPYVMNLMEDKLWGHQRDRDGKAFIRDRLKDLLKGISYDPPLPPKGKGACKTRERGNTKELDPKLSLANFLTFCRDNYPARHYMLFILGHGLVVGNDVFLYDEHADVHWLTLRELGEVLTKFKIGIKDSQFELVSFHSCSVSGLEVAYELQGTANYMLASQGPAFVGSWPYRQILIRVFNDLMEEKKQGLDEERVLVKEMLIRIFYYCLHNSTDFLLAGYSFDLCLCNLKEVHTITEPLRSLSGALLEGLDDPMVRDLILLSHLKSQSYWQESYTDLYDFCFSLSESCKQFNEAGESLYEKVKTIDDACGVVMDKLVKESEPKGGSLIVRAEFAGPAYQYSHGLSVFFPWSEPSRDSLIMEDYEHYRFKETSWHTFLDGYFKKTMRETHKAERDTRAAVAPQQSDKEKLLEDMACLVYNDEGQLSNGNSLDALKVHPKDPTGDDDCTCPSIKNYPHDTRARGVRGRRADPQSTPISNTFFKQF